MGGNEYSGSESQISIKQRDFDDLQNEIAGRSDNVGRNARFRNKEDANGLAAQRRNARVQAQLTALESLLQNDPEYAKLYNDTNDLLNRAETATDNAIDQAMQDLVQHEDALNDMLGQANQLPDGKTRVFKDEYGYIWTENDELVAPKDAEGLVWNDATPSREDFLQQKQKTDDARTRIDDLQKHQIHLGHIRNRMDDHEKPVMPDEMNKFQTYIEETANIVSAPKQEFSEVETYQNHAAATLVEKPPI